MLVTSGVSSWTAQVTLTSAFLVSQGDQTWYLPNDRVSYLSGGPTAGTISLNLCTRGQLGAQTLVQTRDAFRCQGMLGLTTSSVSWNPTLTIRTEATDPAGTYTDTITHTSCEGGASNTSTRRGRRTAHDIRSVRSASFHQDSTRSADHPRSSTSTR